MDFIKLCIRRPVGVTVATFLVVMFGLIGLGAIPIQLTPTVDRPIITVTTNWPGRSPQEVVDEIAKEQEERLKNVSNLKSMRSLSVEGQATVNLEFYIGSDISRALQEVSDALRQVPNYPDEVDEPTIEAADGASENAIAWIIIDIDPNNPAAPKDFDITTLFDALDKEVKPYLERVDGVAEVNIYGGREREARVLLDPVALAHRQLSAAEVIDRLRRENQNVSAGAIAEGKRDYRVRLLGQFSTADQVAETLIAYRDGKPVYLKDVGTVEIGHQKLRGFVRSLGYPSIAMNVIRQSNANVMDVMANVRSRLDEINRDILPKIDPVAGPYLRLRQVYDETTYITSAVDLVLDNLVVGGILASAVLLLFLRSLIPTAVIAIAIPISVIGTFLAMLAMGRTLNVISLAGLAFAVGMVVDNAIVVLENIDRRMAAGEPPVLASYRAAKEVWGAILASTLTTVAVFIPVLTIQEEAGQLFRDISLAVVAAVTLSLIVSITVIPTACAAWLKERAANARPNRLVAAWRTLFGIAPALAASTDALARTLKWAMTGWRGWTVRPALVAFMTAASLWGSAVFIPPMDYLPAGNRNLVFGGLLIPPGYSVDQMSIIAQRLEADLEPYVKADIDKPETVAALPPIPQSFRPGAEYDPVPVENFFIGSFGGGMFVGATSQAEQVVIPIGALLTNAMNTIPDAFGGASQTSLFGRGVGSGSGNTVNVEISGPDLERVIAATEMMFSAAMRMTEFGPGRARPDPANFNKLQQEWQVVVSPLGRELGLTSNDAGTAVRSLVDGAFVGDFFLQGDTIDMVVLPRGGRLDFAQQLASIPVATPAGVVLPLDSVVDILPGFGPQSILRIEELPSVSLQLTPPPGMAIEDVIARVREDLVTPAEQAGLIDSTMRIRMEGTAARLDEVKASMFGSADTSGTTAPWQRFTKAATIALAGIIAILAVALLLRNIRRKRSPTTTGYAFVGLILGALLVAALLWTVASYPQLATARFVWALVVTYLLMCALFESFVYPLVIMFAVPLAIVGGFAGLRIVHELSMLDPTKAPQLLDVLTMLGFVILIGVVVNNAILLVHQSLNFMHGDKETGSPPMPMNDAIAHAVRTRVRPILMTTLTSVAGMLPLVLAPGAGSEMYRGLGAVVIGGLVCSTIFTLVLVPLAQSLTMDMVDAVRDSLGLKSRQAVYAESQRLSEPHPAIPQSNGLAPKHEPARS